MTVSLPLGLAPLARVQTPTINYPRRSTDSWGSSARAVLDAQYKGCSLEGFGTGKQVPLLEGRLWVVYRGLVSLETWLADGSEAVLGLAGPGTIFGRPMSAITPYRALVLASADLLPLSLEQVERSPVLARSLLGHAVRRLEQTSQLKALLTLKSGEDRLRHLLLFLGEEFGQPVAGGVRLTVRLTHQQLARSAQVARVTVTRLLKRFYAEGWLARDVDRHLILLPAQATGAPWLGDRWSALQQQCA